MGSRGRKSSSELAIAVVDGVTCAKRQECPVHLTDAARAVWVQLVNDQPADAFSAKDVPLLEQYCRHVVQGRVLADQIDNFDGAWLADDDGLKRYDRLLAAHEREGRAASSLATRLRITRQAVSHPETVGTANRKNSGTRKPWQLAGPDEE